MLSIDLSGRVAIVTGCTQGIGLGIAKMLAKAGCHVAGCGLSEEYSTKATRFCQQIEEQGKNALYKKVDVKLENHIKSFIEDVISQFGKIDFLVSNAGVNMFCSPEKCESSYWDENMSLNLKSHWLLSKACYPFLKEQKGVILLMTSNHAFTTIPDCFPYNVSKSGIDGLVRALAVQWSADIRVVGIAPGFIKTEGGEKWFDSFQNPQKKKEEVTGIHPVQRLGTVDEVGALCSFLCSQYASFITGTTYLIDGGRSIVMQDI